jgi:hypothetical protein
MNAGPALLRAMLQFMQQKGLIGPATQALQIPPFAASLVPPTASPTVPPTVIPSGTSGRERSRTHSAIHADSDDEYVDVDTLLDARKDEKGVSPTPVAIPRRPANTSAKSNEGKKKEDLTLLYCGHTHCCH